MEHKHVADYPESKEIFVRLENYDGIFSNFDNRPFTKRALSSDFLEEVERATLDKGEEVELVLSVPGDMRSEAHDSAIRDRLHSHFLKHYHTSLAEKRQILKRGWGMVALGIMAMILATLIIFKDPTNSLWLSFLVVFLEPAAWFLLWEGMDLIIFSSKETEHKLRFYRKMSKSHGHIHFQSH